MNEILKKGMDDIGGVCCMVKIKNKHRLKQKEIRQLLDEIHNSLDPTYTLSSSSIETGKIDQYELIFLDGIPCFFRVNGQLFYTLKGVEQIDKRFHQVIVDMGAVKFVTSGADVMAPGIVAADGSIVVDDAVWICDETHKKPLAVGRAVISGEEMVASKKGKAVRILHFIGDPLWKMISTI